MPLTIIHAFFIQDKSQKLFSSKKLPFLFENMSVFHNYTVKYTPKIVFF